MSVSAFADPAPGLRSGGSRWLRALWIVAPLLIAGAAFWGYRSAVTRWAVVATATPVAALKVLGPQTGASSGSAAVAPPPVRATRPAAAGGPLAKATNQPVAGALAATSSNAPAVWPLWDFQLKQPVLPLNPPLTPPNWRLVGSSNDGKQWQLVILRQGKAEPEFYKVGQELPGKYKIETITGEDVTLVQRGRRMVLSYIGY